MAIDQAQLKDDIVTILTAMEAKEVSSKDYFAEQLAQAIVKCIKTADVTVMALSGEVIVAGPTGPQSNATPLTFKGGPEGTHIGGLS
jgi:hypothetical protein